MKSVVQDEDFALSITISSTLASFQFEQQPRK
jgi:hypothetical protein